MKYFKHKDKDVICELIGNELRFGKWRWINGICSEQYSFKELTPEFYNSFEEITEMDFNNIWGDQLHNA